MKVQPKILKIGMILLMLRRILFAFSATASKNKVTYFITRNATKKIISAQNILFSDSDHFTSGIFFLNMEVGAVFFTSILVDVSDMAVST